MTHTDETPPVALVVERGKGAGGGTVYYAAAWHEPDVGRGRKSVKRRIGKAWLDPAGVDADGQTVWKKRRGHVPDGYFDERRAYAAIPEIVRAWRALRAKAEREVPRSETITVRELAHEWLDWFEHVKGSSPSTLMDYRAKIADPDVLPGPSGRRRRGWIMSAFGDRVAREVTVRDVSVWLRGLQDGGLGPRTVNTYRQILRNIYVYGCRVDAYELGHNPVDGTDQRREPPPARLDYFEPEELEALARACEQGLHRRARGRDRSGHAGPESAAPLTRRQRADQRREAAMRRQLDRQDADLFRTLFYSGLRIGEVLALRWRDVEILPDLTGGVLDVRTAVSAGVEKPPKSWRPRTVPLPQPAAAALSRVHDREHFTSDDDYVFAGAIGRRLEYTALRKRYANARDAAGLRPVKLHGLRHAAGSIMAASMPLAAVRDVLGHAQLSTTNRYLHGKIDARAVAAMNAAFGVAAVPVTPIAPVSDPRAEGAEGAL